MLLFRRSLAQPHGQLSTALLRSFQPTRHMLPLNHRSFTSEYLVDKRPTSPCLFTTTVHGYQDPALVSEEVQKLVEESKRDPDTEHGVPHLQPPYRFHDLNNNEIWAYIIFGPNYAESDLLTRFWRKRFRYWISRRASKAKFYESALGSEWYTLVGEARKLRTQDRTDITASSVPAVMKQRISELREEGAFVKGDKPQDKELQILQVARHQATQEWTTGKGALLPYIERVRNGERAEPVVLGAQTAVPLG